MIDAPFLYNLWILDASRSLSRIYGEWCPVEILHSWLLGIKKPREIILTFFHNCQAENKAIGTQMRPETYFSAHYFACHIPGSKISMEKLTKGTDQHSYPNTNMLFLSPQTLKQCIISSFMVSSPQNYARKGGKVYILKNLKRVIIFYHDENQITEQYNSDNTNLFL